MLAVDAVASVRVGQVGDVDQTDRVGDDGWVGVGRAENDGRVGTGQHGINTTPRAASSTLLASSIAGKVWQAELPSSCSLSMLAGSGTFVIVVACPQTGITDGALLMGSLSYYNNTLLLRYVRGASKFSIADGELGMLQLAAATTDGSALSVVSSTNFPASPTRLTLASDPPDPLARGGGWFASDLSLFFAGNMVVIMNDGENPAADAVSVGIFSYAAVSRTLAINLGVHIQASPSTLPPPPPSGVLSYTLTFGSASAMRAELPDGRRWELSRRAIAPFAGLALSEAFPITLSSSADATCHLLLEHTAAGLAIAVAHDCQVPASPSTAIAFLGSYAAVSASCLRLRRMLSYPTLGAPSGLLSSSIEYKATFGGARDASMRWERADGAVHQLVRLERPATACKISLSMAGTLGTTVSAAVLRNRLASLIDLSSFGVAIGGGLQLSATPSEFAIDAYFAGAALAPDAKDKLAALLVAARHSGSTMLSGTQLTGIDMSGCALPLLAIEACLPSAANPCVLPSSGGTVVISGTGLSGASVAFDVDGVRVGHTVTTRASCAACPAQISLPIPATTMSRGYLALNASGVGGRSLVSLARVFVDNAAASVGCVMPSRVFTGTSCVACPDCAVCPGGSRAWPRAGCWSHSEADRPRECSVGHACCGAIGEYPDACPARQLPSGARDTQRCDTSQGATGEYCSECLPGYFRDAGRCFVCDDENKARFAGLVLAGIIMAGVIAAAIALLPVAYLVRAVALLVLLQQVVYAGRDLATHVSGKRGQRLAELFRALSIIYLDVGFLELPCHVNDALTYVDLFWGTLVLGVGMLSLMVGAAGIWWCCGRRVLSQHEESYTSSSWATGRSWQSQASAISAAPSASSTSATSTDSAAGAVVVAKVNTSTLSRRVVLALVTGATVLYLQITQLCIQMVHCSDGRLAVDMSMTCYEGRHRTAAVMAWILLFGFVAAFPITIGSLLVWHGRAGEWHMLATTYAYLTRGLRRRVYWFRLSHFVFTLVLVLVSNLTSAVFIRALLTASVFVIKGVAVAVLWPYVQAWNSWLSMVIGLAAAVQTALFVSLRQFGDDRASAKEKRVARWTTGAVVAVFVVAVAAARMLRTLVLVEAEFKR
ncbi:uncharacterized protein AMSG_07839 [Thecamonas trahens ATCC 50062]|uniref:Uncharacterized protein n=1 Tax=Thecamonas trahens ATCC 50062 TaxID=461836 RepID=A0A0L0DHC5_THETB|nr:hypothetical protein AMSG_07839 [Thecamonas trahens ATCC 50062]KNC51764.1 hypothetical protein AMSG_07839 [Thecamonas trahens ATCC 50062]|eukprot:XP_013755890.1 hypothetical protein AMSG_07839 [Thecamonas trahens ATCC 50062]